LSPVVCLFLLYSKQTLPFFIKWTVLKVIRGQDCCYSCKGFFNNEKRDYLDVKVLEPKLAKQVHRSYFSLKHNSRGILSCFW
jgi:hypothetical protein